MKKPPKLLIASSEVVPFAKTGGLADVAGSLPLTLRSLGCDTKVIMPYYRQIKKQDFGIKLLKADIKVKLGAGTIKFSLYQCQREKVDFYFIEKDEYFDRDFLYGTPLGDYPDNALRFGFFANATLASIAAINFRPDVIHCNDWQTALIPFYLKYRPQYSSVFQGTKTLFTVHNMAYQGLFPKEVMPEIGIDREFFIPDKLEFYGKLSFIKSGILYSDAISTVSKGYAREILTEKFGCGLDGLLNLRKSDLYGILNGADYAVWNPKTDDYIKAAYDTKKPENKVKCKKDLTAQMKLRISEDTPLLGVISRLAEQKGIDIIAESADEIVGLGFGLVILGAGDKKYHRLLKALAKKYPKDIAVKIAFDNALAHKIEAGSDMFLMPSRYEPCGLNQMYSLKYGTIPVVTAVGGLDDTIIDYSQNNNGGNGFKFNQVNKADFINTLKRALTVYKNKRRWNKLVVKAMGFDFSWEESAKEYIKLYSLIKEKK